jgi:hypothetical protein
MFRFERKSVVRAGLALGSVLLAGGAVEAQINLTAGDVALIGWVDNGSPTDLFTVVALADLPAGTQIYFTDNGWDSANQMFRNTSGPANGTGNEQIVRLDTTATVPAGTILTSYAAGPGYGWTASGAIPGANSGSFAALVLAQTGDQIYAFQHDTGQNPLNTMTQQHLFALDDTGTFEPATSTATGDVPPGLSFAAHTALTFQHNSSGQNFMAFDTLALPGGTKADWLAAIGNSANWTFGAAGVLPTGTITVFTNSPFVSFCFGDGIASPACPCGNSGQFGNGCNNSLASGGARLTATGTAHPDTIVFSSAGELTSTATVFVQADASLPFAVPFGDGLTCLSGNLHNLGVKSASAGTATYPESGDPSVSARSAALGDPLVPGSTRYYQAVYRDPVASYCSIPQGDMWNASGALIITW